MGVAGRSTLKPSVRPSCARQQPPYPRRFQPAQVYLRQGRVGCCSVTVTQALFYPPSFEESKLAVQYLPGASSVGPEPPSSRRYTLTHNDVTGKLILSIGAAYNHLQVSGFYTKLLRDEVVAEWTFSPYPELHVYCHVSGQALWIASPRWRDFIFRRDMPLVLDTFNYAEQLYLSRWPVLKDAPVYVHFESHIQGLDRSEYWGVLGDKCTWQHASYTWDSWLQAVQWLLWVEPDTPALPSSNTQLPPSSAQLPPNHTQLPSQPSSLPGAAFCETQSSATLGSASLDGQPAALAPDSLPHAIGNGGGEMGARDNGSGNGASGHGGSGHGGSDTSSPVASNLLEGAGSRHASTARRWPGRGRSPAAAPDAAGGPAAPQLPEPGASPAWRKPATLLPQIQTQIPAQIQALPSAAGSVPQRGDARVPAAVAHALECSSSED